MPFMTAQSTSFDGIDCHVSRSGYTGEDGYEISVRATRVTAIVERLLDDARVKLAGLGARDSLRLEAGLCLYGHDIDETTSPVEAALAWSIPRRRREEGGFPGAARVQDEIANGPARLRVGIKPDGRAPGARGHRDPRGRRRSDRQGDVRRVRPDASTARSPWATWSARFAEPGTSVRLIVRDNELAATIVPLPFVPHRYHRGALSCSAVSASKTPTPACAPAPHT